MSVQPVAVSDGCVTHPDGAITLSTAGPGVFEVTANVMTEVVHTRTTDGSTDSEFQLTLGLDPISCVPVLASHHVRDDDTADTYWGHHEFTRRFRVEAAGDHSFFLNARMAPPTLDSGTFGPAFLSAVFFPDAMLQCSFDDHLTDLFNCGCDGPCSATDDCISGVCQCLPDDHLTDAANCACNGPCDPSVDLEICVDGICVCDTSLHQSDMSNCGCNGPCGGYAVGEDECSGGVCVCDPTDHFFDPGSCGCSLDVCDTSQGVNEECDFGTCRCVSHNQHHNDANCGCNGPCDTANGYRCQAGLCECQNQFDPSACGCPAVDCNASCTGFASCIGGSCFCDDF